jgi:hypothetical protein
MSLFHTELPDSTAICPQCGEKYDIHGFHSCGSIDEAVKDAIENSNREWIEWIEKNLDDISPDCCEKPTKAKCKDCSCPWKKWQERKKGIGL